MHDCRTICWNVCNLSKKTFLKKTDTHTASSHQLPISPQLGVGHLGVLPLSMLGFWLTLSHTGLVHGKANCNKYCNILFILCKYCFMENVYFALHLIWEMWRCDICYWDIWKTIPLKPISFEVFSYFRWLFLRNFPLIDTNLSMIYFISILCLFLSESSANLLAIILTLYINALHTSDI